MRIVYFHQHNLLLFIVVKNYTSEPHFLDEMLTVELYIYIYIYIEKMQPRMTVAVFNGNSSTTVISRYSPINASDETDLDAFYNKLSSLVHSIMKYNVLIIGGDMNAQIGKNKKGTFSSHDSTKGNGEQLMNFTQENELPSLDTKFQKRKGKLWTKTYPNNAKTKIDYILMYKKWINSALDCKVYSSFEGVSSGLRIVIARIRLSLRRNVAQATTTAQYDWFLFNNKDICDKCTITLRNNFKHCRKYQKYLLRMRSMRTSSKST